MAECKRSTAATLYSVQRSRTRKLLSSPFIRRPLPSPYSSRSEDSSFRQISRFRGRRSRSRGDSSPLKIESFLEMIEQDETPRAAAPVRGGDRINFEMVYFRRMCGGGEARADSSTSGDFFKLVPIQDGNSRRARSIESVGAPRRRRRAALSSEGKGRARGCVYVRSRADTDNLLLHLLPDLKSVARSPVFTVSPFFARPPYVSRQFVIAPSEKMAKRTTFRFPLNYPPSESSARVEGGGSKGGFFLLIRCASRLPRGCPDRFLCVESSSRKGCWVYERWLIAPFTLPRDFMAERRTIEKSVETERSA